MKTPISKASTGTKRPNVTSEGKSDRTRDTLMYTDDDERPHAKIDQVVQRHQEQKHKEEKAKSTEKHDKRDKESTHKKEKDVHKAKDESRTPKRRKSESPEASAAPPSKRGHKNDDHASTSARNNRTDDRNKRLRLNSEENEQGTVFYKSIVFLLSHGIAKHF